MSPSVSNAPGANNPSKMGPAKPSMQELYAGPADWDAQREIITRLYLHERRSLQEVMELMALDHNFLATCDPQTPGGETNPCRPC